MTSRDEVRTLFAEANPVPDLDLIDMHDVRAALDDLQQRSLDMIQQTERPHKTPTDRRRAAPWLVAAAVLAVIAIAVVLTNLRVDDPPLVDSVDTTTINALDDPAVAAVLAAIESLNAGDIDGWVKAVAHQPEQMYFRTLADGEVQSGTTHWMERFMASNLQWRVVEPCQVAQATPKVVECSIDASDDWYEPAGFVDDGLYTFHLDENLRITDYEGDGLGNSPRYQYNFDFHDWLRQAHPDVFERIKPNDSSEEPGFLRPPSDMTEALEYVDEFIAQSETYPLDG